MSERDPREELADIARSLARVIQRERPDGELLLQSARAAQRAGAGAADGVRESEAGAGKREFGDDTEDRGFGDAAEGRGFGDAAGAPARDPSRPASAPPPEVKNAAARREGSLSGAPAAARSGNPAAAGSGISRAPDGGASRAPDGGASRVPDGGASAAVVRAPDDVAPPIVDLFGEAKKVRPSYEPLDFSAPRPTLPSHHEPLHPIDAAERSAIHLAALPILNEVAAEARGCRKCGLCDTRTLAVPGVGAATSGIVFVGEAPGADEDAQGEPFVGRAGKLLTEIIKGMNDRQLIPGISLTRETVYICNVLKCRPPENRNPLPHEIEACSPYLYRQLEALKPRIICCLGKFAAELLVGVKGTIRDMRGKVYRYKGARLIVTYHPAAILRSPNQYRRPVWEDMQFLAREYLSG